MRPNNHIILDKIAFFLLLSLTLMITTCKSTGERTTEGQGKIDKLEIRGFTQFPVYTGRNFLGYIEADGQEKTFDKKLWRGKTKQDPIQQSITVSYTKEDLKELKGGFSEILSAEAGYETIQAMDLILENPVQYILEELSLEPEFKNKKELFSKKYIGAVLKVDKIKIEFKNKDGFTVKTEADFKVNNIKLGTNFKHGSSENSVFFAENAFVGYKLFDAPNNPESFIVEEDKRLKVVVLPFDLDDDRKRDEKLKTALAEATARSLNMIENIFVLDRNSYQKILEEQQLAKSEQYDEKKAVQIGKLMTANTIVIGKFSREGLDARITCTMIDVETNALLANGSIKLDINLKGKNSPMIADEWEEKILETFGVKPNKKSANAISILGTNVGDAYDFYWKGREKFILLDEESLEEAIPLLKKAIELDPTYSDAYATLAETYQRLYDFRNFTGDRIGAEKMKIFGLEAATKAIELNPNSATANRVLSFYYFYMDPDFEKSKLHAQKAVDLDPKDAEAAIRLFVIKARENKKLLSPDNKDLLSIHELNPNLISTNYYLGLSYKLAGNYAKAIEQYQKILEISPKTISIYADISGAYAEQEKWEEALKWLDKADEMQPSSFQVQIHYANYFIKKKEYKKANEYLNLAKKLQPKSTIPYEAIANIAIREKNYPEAIANLQKCIELEPKRATFLNQLGYVYKQKGEPETALKHFIKATQIEPKLIVSYDNLANLYLSLKKLEMAIKSYEKCIELEPSNSYYLRAIAEVFIEKEDYDTAISYYNKAKEIDPNEHMIDYELGQTLVLKKEYEPGKEKFNRVIEIGNDEVKSYGYKGLADLKRKQRKYEEAIELYKKGISIFNDNTDAKLGMALTYSKNGNNPEAISIVKSILEKDSQNAKAYFDLGKYQKMEKNSEDSAVSFKKACELGEKKACEETGEKKKKK
ncbi:MAG: tetratricopeptide repeat protein [Leptospiraceae bacterium]|nr:tetratricopeptide repeat protein [Leptospiraceae bacterium]